MRGGESGTPAVCYQSKLSQVGGGTVSRFVDLVWDMLIIVMALGLVILMAEMLVFFGVMIWELLNNAK